MKVEKLRTWNSCVQHYLSKHKINEMFKVLKTRDDGFSPEMQPDRFLDGYKPMKKLNSVSMECYVRREARDKVLWELMGLLLIELHSILSTLYMYSPSENRVPE